jgi:L-asparaginase II
VAEEEIGRGVDGCGVVTFAVPLSGMARAFSALADRAGRESAASRVVDAMTRYPYMVAGKKRLCTTLMSQTEGRVFAKTGAEGLYCAGVPETGLGVALKVEDGARRASDVALLRVLDEIGALTPDDAEALRPLARPPIHNTRLEESGEIRADFRLEWVT